jgi:cytochrome c oxidase subunit II
MIYEMRHMQGVLAEGPIRQLQDWWWRLNFRGYGDSTFADHTDWLFFWIFAITAFFFVLLMVLMFYFSFKYRRRAGAAPLRSRSHNTALELTWSIVPTIILVWMFFEGFRGYANKMIAPAAAPEVLVTGEMWRWNMTYPNGAMSREETRARWEGLRENNGVEGVTAIPIFVMPEATPIKLRMHSLDVVHAFWIPDFRAKFDVYPNRYTSMWFESRPIDRARAERMGWILQRTEQDENGEERQVPVTDAQGNPVYYQDHWAYCAEYCGRMHSEMLAIIRVVPREQFADYMQRWARLEGPPHVVGEALYRRMCASCHTTDGTAGQGPTFRDLYGYPRTFTDGSTLIADENYIRESIIRPGARIVANFPNLMQSFDGRVNEEEINALIAFIRTLSDRGGVPETEADQPQEEPGEQQGN